MAAGEDIKELLKRSDALIKERKFKESFDLLTPYADGSSDDPEVLWRVARMYHGKIRDLQTTDKKQADELTKKGFEISQKALALGSENAGCNKFAGIMLMLHVQTLARKERAAKSQRIRELFEKAVELDSNDMMARHMLGRWHFNVTSIPYAVRLMFSNVPNSTYEQALQYFEEAEKLNEDNFLINWLYLGKTFLQLKKKAEAKPWLTKVIESGDSFKQAVEAKEEANNLLKKL